MSKKIAAGADAIVLDVTCGKGAFMQNVEEAKALAEMMSIIGKMAERETVCVLTNMDEPLGYAVGNSLEVIEAISALKGSMPDDLKEIVLNISAEMLYLSGKYPDIEENKFKVLEVIENGEAFEKFKSLVKKQGGDISYIENIEKFEKAPIIGKVVSDEEGFIEELDAGKVGKAGVELGVGRIHKEDKIDSRLGIVFNKKIGDFVKENEVLAYIHAGSKEKLDKCIKDIKNAYKFGNRKIMKKNIIEII